MYCDKCKKNPATVHYRYSENGNITELHLCAECAKREGIMKNNGTATSGFMSHMGALDDYFAKLPFSSLFSSPSKHNSIRQKICPGCGLSEAELRNGGRLGCAQCYSVFEEIIDGMLTKMHLSTEYKGKLPEACGENASVTAKLEKLKADMQLAVEQQEYEEAARLRDAIRQLESADNDNLGK